MGRAILAVISILLVILVGLYTINRFSTKPSQNFSSTMNTSPTGVYSPNPTQSQPAVQKDITEVAIYLIAIGDNGKSGKEVGCGDTLVAVKRQVAPTKTPL